MIEIVFLGIGTVLSGLGTLILGLLTISYIADKSYRNDPATGLGIPLTLFFGLATWVMAADLLSKLN